MDLSFVNRLRGVIGSMNPGFIQLPQLRNDSARKSRGRKSPNCGLAAEVQLLENRAFLSGSPASQFVATIDLVRYHSGTVAPNAASTQAPPGYTPTQIKQAYGFNQISFNGVAGDGTGTTIAIVDAFDDPNIASDLHQFDLAFGLPDPTFTKVNQNGSTTGLPKANAGWITEIALDVEWAHAIAPGAKILLVEANSDSGNDLYTAVNTARNFAGVDVVSMSWGGGEYLGEQSDDFYFTTPAGHNGVTFLASSGDSGAPISSPGSSPNVVSVGGTTLSLTSSGTIVGETGWSGSGGGISAYEAQPSYQKGIVTQTTTMRANPDVAYDSDPNTGFGVYDSYNNGTTNPWGQWGGTSDAAPQWAALIAIADQGRALAGKGSLDGATQTLPLLYSMSASDFHDITSGTSTGSPHYSAGPGYDLVTGRGSPLANLVVRDLVGTGSTSAAPTLTTISTLGVAGQQTPFAISYATLLGNSNAQDFNGAPIQFRINSVQNGTLMITHNGVTTAVVAGTSLLGPGDSLTWTSAAGVSGSAVNAFTVTAFDGALSSSSAVQVTINVQSFGSAFSLSGPWIVDNAAGVAQGLGRITQTGSSLSFVNSNGVTSSGQYTSPTQIVATNFDGQASVAGTIDTTVADIGRILFADGTVWLRVSLAGTYSVTGPGISSPTLATITQNGTSLTLVSGSTSNSATINTATQLLVSTGRNRTAAATYGDGKITFSSNNQVWTKLDLPTNYTNQSGAPTQVIQNGTSITFVNKFGGMTPAFWTSPTTLFLSAWNESVTTGIGTLTFQDGSIWSENLTFAGANNGSGTTTISAAPSAAYVFDYVNGSNQAVHVVQTGTNAVVFIFATQQMSVGTFINATQLMTPAAPNDIATISNDFTTITWQDGTVWTQTASTGAVTLTNSTNAFGVATHLIQNGSNQVGFVDSLGRITIGTQISPGKFVSDLYGAGDVATISGNIVTWQDGAVWTPTNSAPPTITFTDSNGAAFHVGLTSASTLVGLDGEMAGVSATRVNGQIVWSNGAVWTDFDFNSLNALFEMATGYR